MRTLGLFFAAARKSVLAAAVVCFCSAAASAQLQRNDSERQLFESVNRERAAQGLSALEWDEILFKAARKHALLMLNLNQLEHQLPNEPTLDARLAEAGARFAVIAENIAIGPDPATIHNGWMNSPGHRKNILNPRLTSIGIAVVHGPGGLYAVQDFSQFVPEMSVEQQEQKVVSLLTAKGFRLADATSDARRTCEKDSGVSGTSAKSMMRFEASDLNSLPEEVEKRIGSGPLGKVAVGACHPKGTSGFSRFRVALLFF
ncbi:MAG TPA: CAP domain-containing protein [Candidatus Acidoferrum sp.]|nr:CAP domain-containing protein [Candidatus Acidoferrum sp.]